ncbi:CBS domain-containing protein [Saccharothrix violaceirubra]|uniref:CBS domain-containing protein n=1 Tax=Saccharothrix violaceirubra TaxID=413306 RepID=A0A7W7T337_9PSEU|nr:CBS domain-containing protein [Saccharothrix violaceirubra]MBB4965631.1 CBS domain-containing protein [Saccharothrix violaceirubra]
MRAQDIMTSPAVTVTRDVPSRAAAALMAAHGFTSLPVLEDDRLVGIVTEADLIRIRYTDGEAGDTPVGEVMTTPVFGMDALAPVTLVARVMLADRVRCVPIVDGSRVLGVVTRRDLVRAFARADRSIEDDVRERLDAYGGHEAWTVRVDDGVVTIHASVADENAVKVATALAEAVPGVVDVRVPDDRKGT